MELITMSNKELSRLELIQKLIERRLTQVEVAAILKISSRQVQRLVNSYRNSSANGLVSKKRGKPSNNVISGGDKTKVLAIITERYTDFGPTLAAEKLLLNHGYKVSVETIRKWMMDSALWIPRKQKLKRAHQPRYRRNCLGELVQIDGSYHDWFEGRAPKCCLLVFIDDATSKIIQLYSPPLSQCRPTF